MKKRNRLAILALVIGVTAIGAMLLLRPQRVNDGTITVMASPDDGFFWAYLLYVPDRVTSPYLLVIPNNTGSVADDLRVHTQAAANLMEWKRADADELGTVLLIPVFPRPESIGHVYTHALDRDCLQIAQPTLERLDLQLIAMVEHARERLARQERALSDQVLLYGFSASGMFANRFALLHPDRVRAAAIGSPGGWPIAPAAQADGKDLPYPIGIADVEQLTGVEVDAQAFARIPQLFFLGDEDTNDASETCYLEDMRELTADDFRHSPVERWPKAEALYTQCGANAAFSLYPGVGHEFTDEMREDVLAFLSTYAQ